MTAAAAMSADQLKAEYEAADMRFKRLKNDNLHSRNGVTYDEARAACRVMISACYAFQRAKWGKIMLKMSVASEMR